MFHSFSTSPEGAGKEFATVLEATMRAGFSALVISPNSDPGHERIFEGISGFLSDAKNRDKIRFLPNVSQHEYFQILRQSAMLVGNSSSGMLETGGLGIPCVNVGTRQEGRERGDNVIGAQCEAKDVLEKILIADGKAFRAGIGRAPSPYDGGKTAERICAVLKRADFSKLPVPKKFYDSGKVSA